MPLKAGGTRSMARTELTSIERFLAEPLEFLGVVLNHTADLNQENWFNSHFHPLNTDRQVAQRSNLNQVKLARLEVLFGLLF